MAKEKVDVEKKTVEKRQLPKAEMPMKDAGEQKPKKRRWPAKVKGSGLIFIKHLPRGFHEEEMREFFSQFGDIVRVCVARSKKTMQSKGYGYVHFRFHEVAEIAASAINNYMMFGRVLKANALPKKMTKVPRNFGRAYDSKGEQTAAYRSWINSRVRNANSYLGPQTQLDRVSKQMKRLKRAEKELHEAGIELPETKSSMSKMQEKTNELNQQVKENLAKRAAAIEATEKPVEQEVMDDNDDDDDDEDEETAFSMLEPSDFTETESAVNEKEETESSKTEAVKKAQEKSKEFGLSKSKSAKPITTSNKENKKALPAKKQPKTAKLALDKKKQSEASDVPSLKVKGKLTAKDAKPAKLAKKKK
ncbi:MKI67 FHA domain-interacting nucleolar phosphoprotein [Anopheles marshallii]|uniref:MKI67 FHA domain-interacting nucleolar phosphoprotein n=1 Tax=Anopheles marshallii TaxID=1521116 RepID=UPI00237B620D|nr:MKI67 FHA domain-interacting nucleolar phosphoprotein [Anopheles marshallii]